MPIYVYRNLHTGETFEIEQRMVDAALTSDPVTGDPVKRLIQPVGIAFKGSGFYVTDSRGKNGASTPVAAATSGGKNGGSGEGKADAKTGAAPAAASPAASSSTSSASAAD